MQIISLVKDRYSGCYSGAPWLAFPDEIPEFVGGGDSDELNGWLGYSAPVGKGDTPELALRNLLKQYALETHSFD